MPEPSFIGIDLGGTQLRVAAARLDGTMLDRRHATTDRLGGPQAVVAQMEALVGAVRQRDTVAIGIGVPGAFDGEKGMVLDIPALPGWNSVPLEKILSDRTGLTVILENDAKVAALGEWRAGGGKGFSNFAYVTVSTGIGGGIVAEGRMIRGFRGLAGEVGHTRITDHSAVCSCGRQGCWEAVASGTALARAAKAAIEKAPSSLLAKVAGEDAPTGEHVSRAAREKCPAALAILSIEAEWLAAGFANIQHLYSPQRIVLGGGVSKALDLMHPQIVRSMEERILSGHPVPEIVRAELGDDAGLIGAAYRASETQD
ncbi:ROK family protein [Mesorhizobium sp. 1M-11]|uniref:ROK family protein n=1 Tax=Mesorhizobium sp. 1M-11 TaxID=1529006 RepID=UPI0006C73BA9|nr:ROK family protein [Mesorhizobium sp. 1M-11]